jgi:hypothetical protein
MGAVPTYATRSAYASVPTYTFFYATGAVTRSHASVCIIAYATLASPAVGNGI